MPDPWEEAAKQFKGGAPAPDAGPQSAPASEDWKVWQSGGADGATAEKPGFFRGLIDGPLQTIMHPVQTASGMGQPFAATGMAPGGMYPTTAATGSIRDLEANHAVQQDAQEGQHDAAKAIADNPKYAVGQFLGNTALASLVGGGVEGAPRALEHMRPRSSPDIVPPIEAHAERLGQSILPPGGLTPKLLESIRYEAPSIREFAQRTGNPLKTQAEGLKAAQGVGSEGVTHFNENFLKPNADTQVQLPNNVSPSLGHVATLEQINGRIGEINDLERATAGKSEGATMTAQERLGLQGEAKALRQKLYETLSQRTGVSPDDIRNMREGYGGQYTVANALESARMGRLDRIGKSEQGQNPLNMPHGVGDLVTKGLTALRGGEEAIANRQFASRIRRFSPEAPTRPMPNPDMHPLPAYSEDELRGFIRPKK